MVRSFLRKTAVRRNEMLLGCDTSLSPKHRVFIQAISLQVQHCSLFRAAEDLAHKSTGDLYFHCFHCLSCSPSQWCESETYWISLAGLEQPQGYFLQTQSMNRAFFAVKCHLYEFRKKKVIIPCDSLYQHVPKYPGNYCFFCSRRSNCICLATSACFPKFCSQTKPKNLHIHIFFLHKT